MKDQTNELLRWTEIIEASVYELHRLANGSGMSQDQKLYLNALISYHDANLQNLEKVLEENWKLTHLKKICELRLWIRRKSINKDTLDVFEKELAQKTPKAPLEHLFLGESFFVLAFAAESIFELEKAIHYYEEASRCLNSASSYKKSLKALFNRLACKSRIFPESRYLSDCYFIIREASRLNESSVEAMARHNLSYELFKLGALEESLSEGLRALKLCEDHFVNFNEIQVRLHLADLYFRIGDFKEAKRNLSLVKTSNFLEAHEAVKFLENSYLGSCHSIDESKLTYNWKKRIERFPVSKQGSAKLCSETKIELSPLESRCLKELAKGPIEKHKLLDEIYGESGSYLSLENRLKVLLNRLRKKVPNEIQFFKGRYFLKDKSLRNLIVLFALATTSSLYSNDFPDIDSSLVKVCSSYTGSPKPICGVGTYVQKNKDYFVISSAHVSQGDLGISIQSLNSKKENLEIISRATNNLSDIEVIQVKATFNLKPLLIWDSYYDSFVIPEDEKWSWHFLIGRSKMPDADSPSWMHNLGWTSALLLPTQDKRISPLKGEPFYNQFFPATAGFENRRNFSQSLDPYENLIRFKLLPGMSGAPVLSVVAEPFHVKLSMIATRSHRYSPLSYFANLNENLLPLLKGKSESKTVSWQFKNNLLYRSTSDNTHEAAYVIKEKGDWGSADGGDWGSADGGNLKSLAIAASLKFIYKGTPLLGWKVKISKNNVALFHGSFSNYRTLLIKKLLDKATPIPTEANVANEAYKNGDVEAVSSSGDILKIKDGNLSVELKQENISFTLNQWGALTGKIFSPIIKVGNKTLDITELYFIEASYRRPTTLGNDDRSFNDKVADYARIKRILIGNRIVSWTLP